MNSSLCPLEQHSGCQRRQSDNGGNRRITKIKQHLQEEGDVLHHQRVRRRGEHLFLQQRLRQPRNFLRLRQQSSSSICQQQFQVERRGITGVSGVYTTLDFG